MAAELRLKVVERIDDEYGLDCPQLFIVNISLPEEVEKALDTRTKMSMFGDLDRFQQFQMGEAMTMAAANQAGGRAAEGLGLGIGLAMANRMTGSGMTGGVSGAAPGQSVPPPPPTAAPWHVAVNGQTLGPYSVQQMTSGVSRSEVTPETLVWTAGMPAWLCNRFSRLPPAP